MMNEEINMSKLADEYVYRIQEISDYQSNINRYEAILSILPTDDIPKRLESYKKLSVKDIPIDISIEDILTIDTYQEIEDMNIRLRNEYVQQAKTIRIKNAVLTQLPLNLEIRDKLIEKACLKRDRILSNL